MARHDSRFGQRRWVSWRNDSAEEAPPFAALAVTDFSDFYLTCVKPGESNSTIYALNGHNPVSSGKYGQCTFDYPATARIESGTPILGEVWGPENTWGLVQEGRGFTAVATQPDGDQTRVIVLGEGLESQFWAFLMPPIARYDITIPSDDTEESCPPTIEQSYLLYSWGEARDPVNSDPQFPYRMSLKPGGRFGTAAGGGGEDCGGARDVNNAGANIHIANTIVRMHLSSFYGDLSECDISEISSSVVTVEGHQEDVLTVRRYAWFSGGFTGREECKTRLDIDFEDDDSPLS